MKSPKAPGPRIPKTEFNYPSLQMHVHTLVQYGELSEHSPGASFHGRYTRWERSLCLDPDQDTNQSSESSAAEHQGRGSHTKEKGTEKQIH